jgi:hypothetical protein
MTCVDCHGLRRPSAGAASAMLMPLVEAIRAHVFAAQRIHADDTTVPVLAKGKCRTGRLWSYVRDDRPFGGTAAPARSSTRPTVAPCILTLTSQPMPA